MELYSVEAAASNPSNDLDVLHTPSPVPTEVLPNFFNITITPSFSLNPALSYSQNIINMVETFIGIVLMMIEQVSLEENTDTKKHIGMNQAIRRLMELLSTL